VRIQAAYFPFHLRQAEEVHLDPLAKYLVEAECWLEGGG